jgi:putative flippase GtrA
MDSWSIHRSVAGRVASPRHAAGDRAASLAPGRSLRRDLGRFAVIGVASTAAYTLLFAVFRTLLAATPASALALLVSAIGNTAANRRLTFGVRGRQSLVRDHGAGLAAFGIALAITTGSMGLLSMVAPNAGRVVELGLLTLANGLATVIRFVLLRTWIAGPRSVLSNPSRA